eukprot:7849542-Heterocapsa_arctica.AAC.1
MDPRIESPSSSSFLKAESDTKTRTTGRGSATYRSSHGSFWTQRTNLLSRSKASALGVAAQRCSAATKIATSAR